jgi:hypothetical protein
MLMSTTLNLTVALFSALLPSVLGLATPPPGAKSIQCGNTDMYCDERQTCCKMNDGSYSCCPYGPNNGVCCPSNYTCCEVRKFVYSLLLPSCQALTIDLAGKIMP